MTLHAPFIFDVFRVLYFSSHHFMRVYMELFRQRADVELKLERERKLFKFKEEGTCQLFSAREREIRNFIWIISSHGFVHRNGNSCYRRY